MASALEERHEKTDAAADIGDPFFGCVEQAGFAVLKSPDVPSILVETGFISNVRDSERLVTARHQQAVADGLFEGLQRYFKQNPPVDSYMAWSQEHKQGQV